MSEQLVLTVFLFLCAGQAVALLKGRVFAVRYYVVAAPLGYFSVWQYLTWGPGRVCGLLLILGGIFLWRPPQGCQRFARHPFALFLAYLTVITLIGSFFWPIEAMAGRSAIYGSLRGFVQIFNWIIILGVAWQIALAVSELRGFRAVRSTIITVGMAHAVYAVYQVAAFYTHLPLTGLRRPASRVGADFDGEQFGMDHFGDMSLYRASSFVGEPKSFGVISLLWVVAILTLYLERGQTGRTKWGLALALLALGLTYSTTAWTGCALAVALFLSLPRHDLPSRLRRVAVPIAILVLGFTLAAALGLLPVSGSDVLGIMAERSTRAWHEVAAAGPTDMPEVEARQILSARPWLAVFGTGLGGMSFYIAQSLLGSQKAILFPNAGILALICDMGIVGLVFLVCCVWRGVRPTLSVWGRFGPGVRSLSYMGTVLLAQCFIFSGGLLPYALGVLLGAEFLSGRVAEEPAAHPGEGCRTGGDASTGRGGKDAFIHSTTAGAGL